jgi:hypothetical protein
MIEAMELRITSCRSSSVALPTTFYESLSPGASKVTGGGHTDRQKDRQTGDLISLLLFLKTSVKSTFGETSICIIRNVGWLVSCWSVGWLLCSTDVYIGFQQTIEHVSISMEMQ